MWRRCGRQTMAASVPRPPPGGSGAGGAHRPRLPLDLSRSLPRQLPSAVARCNSFKRFSDVRLRPPLWALMATCSSRGPRQRSSGLQCRVRRKHLSSSSERGRWTPLSTKSSMAISIVCAVPPGATRAQQVPTLQRVKGTGAPQLAAWRVCACHSTSSTDISPCPMRTRRRLPL